MTLKRLSALFKSNTLLQIRKMSAVVPKITLSNGQEMPMIGLGTTPYHGNNDKNAVKLAIDIGYRHIDTAFIYKNEQEVGNAINNKIAEGVVKREDLFVVTKLGGIHHERVEHGCRLSLKNLQLDYVDLYLIHFPVGKIYESDENVHGGKELADVDYVNVWKAMEKLVDAGLARGIGVSNFNAEQIERILQNCRIKPVVNQVECHPCFNQRKLIAFLKERDIVLTAFCPLARPDAERQWPNFLFDGTAHNLGKKYGKTAAQVCLRYLLQIGVVPIPKSINENRLAENLDVFDFELSAEDIQIMDGYNTSQRVVKFKFYKTHKYFPFNAEY